MSETGAGGLYEGFEGYRTPSDDELVAALNTGLVTLDTNVLLDFYRYNSATRAAMAELLSALGNRLWIANHALEEFWRNRERALMTPLAETSQSAATFDKQREAACETLRMWVNRAALDADEAAPVLEGLTSAFESARKVVEGLIAADEVNAARNTNNDPVLILLEPILAGRVGSPMSPDENKQAIDEGNRRVREGRPPGHEDDSKLDRGTEGAAGDYLVWAQILAEASVRKSDVVLVTGDMKRDWWRYEGKNPRGPRVELVRELRETADATLFMLPPDRFLSYAAALSVTVSEGAVEEVGRASRATTGDDESTLGWTKATLERLLRRLSVVAPVQEATIRLAGGQGGYISREQVYGLGDYDPQRQLKGFTRPVNRLVQELRDSGELAEQTPDLLTPVYDQMKHGFGWVDGFRVPPEVVDLIASN